MGKFSKKFFLGRLVGTKEQLLNFYKKCSGKDFSIIFIASECSYFSATGGKFWDFFSNFSQIDIDF